MLRGNVVVTEEGVRVAVGVQAQVVGIVLEHAHCIAAVLAPRPCVDNSAVLIHFFSSLLNDTAQFSWGGANGDGAWRGLVTIVELIDPRPYIFQPAVYGRLIYAVIHMSDRLF